MALVFPGIDPFLEDRGYWSDFHSRVINTCVDAILTSLPRNYEALIDERLNLFEEVREDLPGEPQSFIEIYRNGDDRELVAVVEVLSPTNKAKDGRKDYLIKRNAVLAEPIHLIELDFLVRGLRLPMSRPLPRGDYFVMVARSGQRPDGEVYSWSVRQRPPNIRFPIADPDPDLKLDLGQIVSTAYERSRYTRLKYNEPLALPLAPEDRAWAENLAKASLGS